MPIQLQILNGKRRGMVFDLSPPGDRFVGQRESAEIRIDDPWISWDHARIFHQNNEVWIEDLHSTNGSYVNCQRVKVQRLNNEDIIFFGKTHALFLQTSLSNASEFQRGLDQFDNQNNVWNSGQGALTPGMGPPGMGAPGMGAPGMGAPGMGAPGMGPPGMDMAGMDIPSMDMADMGGMGHGGMGMGSPMGDPLGNMGADPFASRSPGLDPFSSGSPGSGMPQDPLGGPPDEDSDEFSLFGSSADYDQDSEDDIDFGGGLPMASAGRATGARATGTFGAFPNSISDNSADIEKMLSTSSLDDLEHLIGPDGQRSNHAPLPLSPSAPPPPMGSAAGGGLGLTGAGLPGSGLPGSGLPGSDPLAMPGQTDSMLDMGTPLGLGDNNQFPMANMGLPGGIGAPSRFSGPMPTGPSAEMGALGLPPPGSGSRSFGVPSAPPGSGSRAFGNPSSQMPSSQMMGPPGSGAQRLGAPPGSGPLNKNIFQNNPDPLGAPSSSDIFAQGGMPGGLPGLGAPSADPLGLPSPGFGLPGAGLPGAGRPGSGPMNMQALRADGSATMPTSPIPDLDEALRNQGMGGSGFSDPLGPPGGFVGDPLGGPVAGLPPLNQPPGSGPHNAPFPMSPPVPAGGLDGNNDALQDIMAGDLPARAELVKRLSMLQEENRRLKSTLQASAQQNPSAFAQLSQVLKDQDLSRLQKDLADARSRLVEAREELEARSEELDTVTEEMIEKEDEIDSLREALARYTADDGVIEM